ncbi:MAG: helix-turn-helix domain-containing protein [Anaerolineae bacterium]|nr:helix-turn-helix domain-containing protein [Anaerolineae bacterium]
MDGPTDSFGEWLKQQRKALDLTQKDLAERVGYSLVVIQQLEQGRRRPSKEITERLAVALKIPEEELAAFIKFAHQGLPPRADLAPAPPLSVGQLLLLLGAKMSVPVTVIIALLLLTRADVQIGYSRSTVVCSATEYDQKIEAGPFNPVLRFKRGQLYFDREEYQCSVADFDHVIQLSPDHAWAYYARGSALLKEDFYDRAISDFGVALEDKQLQAYDWIYWKRGLAYKWKGETEKSLADFKVVLQITKNPELRKLASEELDIFCGSKRTPVVITCP